VVVGVGVICEGITMIGDGVFWMGMKVWDVAGGIG
jgi:hypothetical protein